MSGARAAVVALALLVVPAVASAAAPPTIVATPSVLGWFDRLSLSGTVPGAGAGEPVRIEAQECGADFFRVFGGTNTGSGGSWTFTSGFLRNNTRFRARAHDEVSAAIVVQRRASVGLRQEGRSRIFVATVFAPEQSMHGRTIRLERFTQNGWRLVRSAKLRATGGGNAEARFRVATRGLQLHIAVPEVAARPCYAAGVSRIVRS